MADAHGSGPCVRKDVGVQLPPRPPCSVAFGPPSLVLGVRHRFWGATPQTPTVRFVPDPAWSPASSPRFASPVVGSLPFGFAGGGSPGFGFGLRRSWWLLASLRVCVWCLDCSLRVAGGALALASVRLASLVV